MTSVAAELAARRRSGALGGDPGRGGDGMRSAFGYELGHRTEPVLRRLGAVEPDRRETPTRQRLPPGQIVTRKWPVLHYGIVPTVDLRTWRFEITGAVERPLTLSWSELLALPRQQTLCDIHCVTRWSRFDNMFEGVPVRALLRAGRTPPGGALRPGRTPSRASPPTCRSPISTGPENLLALSHGGEPLAAEHGGPVRLLVPHLYFWKSAKWVTGFELLEEDYPGFWEQNGYHMRGDPWAEERYRADPIPVRMRRGPGDSRRQLCLSRPTRFFCLPWPNHPAARRRRPRRTSGSRRSFGRPTAGRGRLPGR